MNSVDSTKLARYVSRHGYNSRFHENLVTMFVQVGDDEYLCIVGYHSRIFEIAVLHSSEWLRSGCPVASLHSTPC
jgi:hypothetical protein